MENIFLEKFHKVAFTKSQKKIAQYCIDHQLQIGQKTLRQMAEEADVSEVSVLNFVRKLGFEGFADFRKWAFDKITEQAELENTENQRSLSQRMESGAKTRYQGSLMQNHIRTITQNVELSLLQNKPELYDKIAERLLNSHRTFVMGTRSSAGVADHFALGLQYLMDNVSYLEGIHRGMIQTLSGSDENDTLVLICLSRYYKTDAAICKMAKERGVHLILLSDSAISPIAVYADELLVANLDSGSFFNSEMGLVGITEYLLALLAERKGSVPKERWEFIDAHMEKFRI